MNNTDIIPLLRRQLNCLLKTLTFLDETYSGNMPEYLRSSVVDIAANCFIPSEQFIAIRDDVPYSISFMPVVFPVTKSINDFRAIGRALKEQYYAYVYNAGSDGIALLNTTHIIRTYLNTFVMYLNMLYDGGPKYGIPNRQIEYGPSGSTENAAWFNQFNVNIRLSMSTFSKAVSDILYNYGINKVARPEIRFINDLINVDINYFDMQSRPVYVEPKIPN